MGLGKTHLMHSVGLSTKDQNAQVLYVHPSVLYRYGESKVNAINEFKRFYRSLDALLIDDIQFFAERAFTGRVFHTFNALLEEVSK